MRKNNVLYYRYSTWLFYILYLPYIYILFYIHKHAAYITLDAAHCLLLVSMRGIPHAPPSTVDRSAGSILDAFYRPPPLHAVYFVIIIIHSNRNRFCVDKFLAFIPLCLPAAAAVVVVDAAFQTAYPLGWRLLCIGTFLYSTIKKFIMKFMYLEFCLYVYYKSYFFPFRIYRVFLS